MASLRSMDGEGRFVGIRVPDFTLDDVRRIEEAAEQLMPDDIRFAEYKVAHKVLADRAEGAPE